MSMKASASFAALGVETLLTVLALSLAACTETSGGAPGGGGSGATTGSAGAGGGGGAAPCTPGDVQCDPANCGAANHDCLGGACVDGTCQPVLLVEEPALGFGMTSDAIFGVGKGGATHDMCPPPWVFRVSKSGGPVEHFVSRRVDGVSVYGGYVYFWQYTVDPFECEANPGEDLYRVPVTGGVPKLVRKDAPDILAFADDNIYTRLVLADGSSQFETYPAAGGPMSPIGVPFQGDLYAFVGMDASSLYWCERTSVKHFAIRATSIVDGTVRTLIEHDDMDAYQVMDDGFVYYNIVDPQTKTSAIHRVPLGGGAPETLYVDADGSDLPLLVVGDSLYMQSFVHKEYPRFVAIPRAGGVPRTVLDGWGVAELLADDQALYFDGGTTSDHHLYRLAR